MNIATNSCPGSLRPEDALQRYEKFLHEDSGFFVSLRECELPWESPIHVCAGELKPEFCLSAHSTRPAISAKVCGSGVSAAKAKVSCLCEALERQSGIFRGDELRRIARYSEIAEEAIHPDALTLFSERQYSSREQWNQREGRYNWVPERFDPARSIEWSPVWSLTQGKTKYLPTAYCYFGYSFDSKHDFCRPDSNGNAAGNDLDEAIVRGFLELVERECASVWWYNRARRPSVDIESFRSPTVTEVCNFFALIGRRVDVLDITADQAIPVFAAVSRSEKPCSDDYALGFGAHFDARIALTKAAMELTQSLPVVLSDRSPTCFLRTEDGENDMPFLAPDEQLPTTACSDFSSPVACEPKQQVQSCIELARSWGVDMLSLEQTRENIGMPVVKVVVPGMRSWWARFAPGRLYTLPVEMGWLSGLKLESELNPDHLIL